MTKERWNYIKQLQPREPRLVWDSLKRGTFNAGRNAKKRAARQR